MTLKPPKNRLRIFFICFNQWSITFSIPTCRKDISSIIINYNNSYWHMSLFLKFDYRFDMFANVCWIGMFKIKCIVLSSILNVILLVDVTIYIYLVKSNDRSLIHNCDNPCTINFKEKYLLVPTPPIKNRCVGILWYILFMYMWYHQILILFFL
jgi:hypothetical protein